MKLGRECSVAMTSTYSPTWGDKITKDIKLLAIDIWCDKEITTARTACWACTRGKISSDICHYFSTAMLEFDGLGADVNKILVAITKQIYPFKPLTNDTIYLSRTPNDLALDSRLDDDGNWTKHRWYSSGQGSRANGPQGSRANGPQGQTQGPASQPMPKRSTATANLQKTDFDPLESARQMRTLRAQYQDALDSNNEPKLNRTWKTLQAHYCKHVKITNKSKWILRGLVVELTEAGKFMCVVDNTEDNRTKLQNFQDIASILGSECRHCVTALSD